MRERSGVIALFLATIAFTAAGTKKPGNSLHIANYRMVNMYHVAPNRNPARAWFDMLLRHSD